MPYLIFIEQILVNQPILKLVSIIYSSKDMKEYISILFGYIISIIANSKPLKLETWFFVRN